MSAPRIFYFVFSHPRPTGGQKHAYRHVDLLVDAGYEAWVLHRAPGFRLRWFENQTPVADGERFAELYDPSRDIVVLPEDLGPEILRFPGAKVIFNRNLYHGFAAFDGALPEPDPYVHPEVLAVLAVSEHNQRLLQLAYPGREIMRVSAETDAALFRPRPLPAKRPRIVCLGSKARPQLLALQHILRARAAAGHNALASWEWVTLTEQSEAEVAAALGEALIFLFLSTEEGRPRLPLEALAAGCLVGAYRGGPLAEAVPEESLFTHGDLEAMVRWVEQVAAAYPARLGAYEAVVARGRAFALSRSKEAQRAGVLDAWARILAIKDAGSTR